jgi:hypothetical protein
MHYYVIAHEAIVGVSEVTIFYCIGRREVYQSRFTTARLGKASTALHPDTVILRQAVHPS